MVGAGLLDRFGLGALGKARVAEACGKAVALLLGGRYRLRQSPPLRVEIDHTFKRERVGGSPDNNLGGTRSVEGGQLDRFQSCQP